MPTPQYNRINVLTNRLNEVWKARLLYSLNEKFAYARHDHIREIICVLRYWKDQIKNNS